MARSALWDRGFLGARVKRLRSVLASELERLALLPDGEKRSTSSEEKRPIGFRRSMVVFRLRRSMNKGMGP